MLKPVILLMGPTASGKTDLAMQLSDRMPCDIISVDSAMIYREMNIGTAKPSQDVLDAYPHQLIDLIDPSEAYSAARFRSEALVAIEESHRKGRMPLLVGGTMLYFHALVNGLAELPEANAEIRAAIQADADLHGWTEIHRQLSEVDPVSAKRLNPNDSQRLQRALEIYRISGRPMTELWEEQEASKPQYDWCSLAVMPSDRAVLHQRIELRFKQMLEQGFMDEVEALYRRGDLLPSMPSMRSVGYRQAWDYLEGISDYETMCYKGVVATRQLAKRQITWLRSWQNLNWLDSHDDLLAERVLKLVRSDTI